mgnify:CR=1 FL=1
MKQNKESRRSTIIEGDVLDSLRDDSIGVVDTVITSPPYNCGVEYDGCSDDMDPTSYFEWIEMVSSLVGQRLRPGGYAIWNVPNYLGNRSERIYALDEYKSIFSRHVPFDDLIIWKKHPPHTAAWGCPPHPENTRGARVDHRHARPRRRTLRDRHRHEGLVQMDAVDLGGEPDSPP